MSRIQSSVGLITGIPIEETVNKLMAIAARPRELMVNRNKLIESERLAITKLTSLMLAFEFEVNKLSTDKLFQAKTVTSSDESLISAKLAEGGNPALGNYRVRPLQTATAHQLSSSTLQSLDDLASEGTLTFGFGGHVDKGISLSELNGGLGVRRGQIRITDRAGNTADVDLRLARTADDVLDAINNNGIANITASIVGDTLRLTDSSGGSGNLRVQELGGGQTALDLGLAGINVAANTATGTDILTLHDRTKLSFLNDGNGVPLATGADLLVSLADGTNLSVDLGSSTTLGEVLDALNAANPAKLSASIAADGNRLELTDLTTGAGTFAVTSVGSGSAAEALGLTTAAAGDTLTGGRLISGLRDTLVNSLRGGQGLGTLGEIEITNRNNVASTVDLSGAETLAEIIAAFNAQAVGVTAAVNSARNGIVLTDTTGGTASNLIVVDGDATNTATALGIVFDDAATTANSGTLERQQVSRATLLSSLNGGKGIDLADILIVDSNGSRGAVDLNTSGNEAKTIGDVIDRINAITTADVEARINDTGDGILLIDNANGAGTLEVKEVGANTAAADLRLLGTGVAKQVGNATKQVIDGTSQATIDLADLEVSSTQTRLGALAAKINSLDAGVSAAAVFDGIGYRLLLTADETGSGRELLIDGVDAGLGFEELSRPRDAVIEFGGSSFGGGLIVASPDNTFEEIIPGVELTILNSSNENVTVEVDKAQSDLVTAVQDLVDAFNSVRANLDEVTSFNEVDQTTGILFGTTAALRVESDLNRVLSGRFFGVGTYSALGSVGLTFDDKGKLEFDTEKFEEAFAADPAAVEELFTHETLGVSAKLKATIEQLAGEGDSVLGRRAETLGDTIEGNNARIASMDARLARQREQLLAQFFQLESTIASMQDNLTALSSLQVIPPLTRSSTNSR
ncbi:MAG TPA: flagellar filament capping protein FliD [Lacipirellulaceae bacterium]|jgi:flagellar hook-associated protein 2|nr:flagellar filament capping protein FliD [Lacipirellulaceae bacterium]